MNQPITHARKVRKARARFSKAACAADTIRDFGHDMDIVGLTYGQFSLIDLIEAALDITGPADVTISTWSAGFYDVEAAKNFRDNGKLRSVRFVMDSGRAKKGQAGVYDIDELFGEGHTVQVCTHAKFVLIRNDEWNVTITSSMNLNKNIRCEQFEMTDDAGRCDMFQGFVDAAFEDAPPSGDHGRTMPGLPSMPEGFQVSALAGVSRNSSPIRLGVFTD
jgi:hypothetical protein